MWTFVHFSLLHEASSSLYSDLEVAFVTRNHSNSSNVRSYSLSVTYYHFDVSLLCEDCFWSFRSLQHFYHKQPMIIQSSAKWMEPLQNWHCIFFCTCQVQIRYRIFTHYMNTNAITRATVCAPVPSFISQVSRLACYCRVICYFRFFKTYQIMHNWKGIELEINKMLFIWTFIF